MKNCILRAPSAALALAVLAALPSHAQTVASGDLSETVVTATRFAEPLASLPLGVSVISADQIRASGASTVNEAVMKLLGVPGRQDSYGGGDYALDLRGFGTTSDSNQVVVLDGVRLNEADLGGTRLAGIPIDSVERIEVLRGSGSVLYGEGATGGVIVITTKAGNGTARRNSATLYGAVGSNALRELRANATVASGGFSLDLHGQRRETDNHRDNFRSETDGAGFTAQWSNDTVRLGLRHDRDALDTGLPGSLDAAQYAANPRQTDSPFDRASIRNERSGVFGEAMLGNWQLGVDAGWREKSLDTVQPTYVYGYDVDARQLAFKARHVSRWAGMQNSFVVGHDRGEWDRDVRGTFGSSVAEQTSRGWYLKDDLTLASGTRFSAGVRTEKLDKSVDDGFALFRLSERETAWELGVSQPLSSVTTVWGRVGNSFRLANVDEFSFTNPAVAIRPQTSRDLETGLRWARGEYKLEARLYRSNLTDEIGYDRLALGPMGGANINFDPTRRQGLEIDGDWKLSNTLSLGARVALRRSTFRDGPYSGKDVPLAPRRTLALRADWVPLAGHRVSGGVNFVGSQHPDFANVCRMPAYTTADARYAVQVKNMELSFGVNNLFDRDYYTQAFGCAGGQTTSIYPEAGRTFTAALRVSF
ncbi:TonB-dependent receptor [Hydrogenophaga sp. PBL-H3]|uniref:TonB-dependent receptor n=1 Tax=Hydrogenophaga sp. PBL-H3 TaxID=434010 RepID=UPI00131F9435|nr:TonB-dependent receptor [Hydrogenophaga sp. PBL-H3]QHE76268.1 TonB-dependent receptor [Hydrogenophaga sp. PBL-H3]QHE80692.1 TonB-dependent receptor [Hydrogenophaga sp. PBL-H3]